MLEMYDMVLWIILLIMLSARVSMCLGAFLLLSWSESSIRNFLLKYENVWVLIDEQVTLDGETCFETDQVILQPGSYFGVSAGTGDMPDHHQLFSFKVTPLEATEPAQPKVQPGNTVSSDKTSVYLPKDNSNRQDDVGADLDKLTKQIKEWQDQSNIVLRRIEASVNVISKSLVSLSGTVNQLQKDITNSGGSSASVADTLKSLSNELAKLETALKDHMSGHVGILSESLVGRGGFWKGIWMVIGVQTAGWVIYEIYRGKKDTGKKIVQRRIHRAQVPIALYMIALLHTLNIL